MKCLWYYGLQCNCLIVQPFPRKSFLSQLDIRTSPKELLTKNTLIKTTPFFIYTCCIIWIHVSWARLNLLTIDLHIEKSSDKVLHFIQSNPGCHFRQVKNELHLSMGTVQYQLAQLEKLGKITSLKRGLYRFYFASGIFRDNEQDILQILSQETAREILMFIIERKNPSQTDIVNRTRLSPSSVNWHVKRLIASQIIKEIRVGRYKKYQLEDHYNSKHIVKLLRNYYPNVWDNWSIRVVDTFLSLSRKRDEDIE